MVAEGSVLAARQEPTGAAVDVAPDNFAHPVYRSGFALALQLPAVKAASDFVPVETPSEEEAGEHQPSDEQQMTPLFEESVAESAAELSPVPDVEGVPEEALEPQPPDAEESAPSPDAKMESALEAESESAPVESAESEKPEHEPEEKRSDDEL